MAEIAQAGDVYQVVTEGRFDGQLTANVWHFKATTGVQDVEQDLIVALIQCFIINLIPVLSNDWTFERVRWQKVSPAVGLEFVTVAGADLPSGNGGDGLPGFCAAVCSIRTTRPGRSGRGRKFIAGIPESGTNAGQILATDPFWNGLLNFTICVLNKFVGDDNTPPTQPFKMQLLSRKIGGKVLPYPANAFADVVTFIPRNVIGSMNSRKIGRGA